MLVDLPDDAQNYLDALGHNLGETVAEVRKVGPGLYLTSWNADTWLRPFLDDDPYQWWPKDDDDTPQQFGVCDTPGQVVQRWPSLFTDDRRLVALFTEVRRDAQPAQGGWRWHKWGEYIGACTPKHEYLADETDIDRVFVFHIFGVIDPPYTNEHFGLRDEVWDAVSAELGWS
jgi:hypothetical protein